METSRDILLLIVQVEIVIIKGLLEVLGDGLLVKLNSSRVYLADSYNNALVQPFQTPEALVNFIGTVRNDLKVQHDCRYFYSSKMNNEQRNVHPRWWQNANQKGVIVIGQSPSFHGFIGMHLFLFC